MRKPKSKRASMQLPADLVQYIKQRAAAKGVPMYAVVERKFARERQWASQQSWGRIDPTDRKAVAAWNQMAGISKGRRA